MLWRGEVVLAAAGTTSHAACSPPSAPLEAQQRCYPMPRHPAQEWCCMGRGQMHAVVRRLLPQLQTSILRSSQSCLWLWSSYGGPSGSGFLCALGDRSQLLWPQNTVLCLRLDCIPIACVCENEEIAIDVSVLNRPSHRSFVA